MSGTSGLTWKIQPAGAELSRTAMRRDPVQVLGSGDPGSAREERHVKDFKLWRAGMKQIEYLREKLGALCGASRGGIKGQVDKDRHTLSVWCVLMLLNHAGWKPSHPFSNPIAPCTSQGTAHTVAMVLRGCANLPSPTRI